MSRNNPFRHPPPSHAQETTAPPPSPPLPPLPPPSPPTRPSAETSDHPIPPPPAIDEDDLPPPYTPAANVDEATIGVGPRRPFQQAPSAPSSSSSHLHWPPPRMPPPQSYPAPVPGHQSNPAPWQSQQQYRQRQSAGGGLLGALFDTVRDIADSISGNQDEHTVVANAGAYAAPYPNTGTMYAPPPGPPVQHHPPRPTSTPPHTSSSSTVSDDGSPTRTPVPGHPLLLHGNLLVYPKDYLCVKCKNTGYKNYDPSHPCRKCWEKYGKPYTGALSYTPWSSTANDPRMQRPLPKFVPPHLADLSPPFGSGSQHRRPYPPPPQHPHHSRSVSHPHYSSPGPSYYVVNPIDPDYRPPVPHAIPVNPGDPRLGGRLCSSCGGEGYRTVMLIDVMMCDTCGGTGRIWV